MTSTEKRMIDQYRQKGMSYADIAASLNLSVNTVKSYCLRNKIGIETEPADQEPEPVSAVFSAGLCRQCGTAILSAQNRADKHFCSDKCRKQWWHAHRSESLNATDRVCPACGRHFRTNRQQKFCCHACYIVARFGGKQHEVVHGTI